MQQFIPALQKLKHAHILNLVVVLAVNKFQARRFDDFGVLNVSEEQVLHRYAQ